MENEAPVLGTNVSNISHSIFPKVEVHINNQQIYNSNGLYVYKSNISNKCKRTNFEYKGALYCVGYDYEKFPDGFMEAPLS